MGRQNAFCFVAYLLALTLGTSASAWALSLSGCTCLAATMAWHVRVQMANVRVNILSTCFCSVPCSMAPDSSPTASMRGMIICSSSGMASIGGISDDKLQKALDDAAKQVGKGKAYIANYMFPEGRTCSGDLKVLVEKASLEPRPHCF